MIKKPEIKDNEEIWDCVSRVFKRWADPPMPGDDQYDEFRQEIEREIAQFYIDKCYKEMLGQLIKWGNTRCLEHHTSMNNIIRRCCNECWQALQSQLEEG